MALYPMPRGEVTAQEKREISLRRAAELKKRIEDYLRIKDQISTGFDLTATMEAKKKEIMACFGAGENDWQDWRWQLKHRISDPDLLGRLMHLEPEYIDGIKKVGRRFRWAISPYYATLVTSDRPGGPVWRQAVPDIRELDISGYEDPMAEEFTSPAPGITRRYPDRLIINVTNQCAMYCRHCQRRRNIGEVDRHKPVAVFKEALDYIRNNPEIRDVLITGGDALMLSDQMLDWLLGELDGIGHVEIKRIGTRVIVTMPQRITPQLCAVLEKHPPVYINTQFNHPREVTAEAAAACDRLIRAGVVLGNQAVLLKDVNNDPHVMKKLNQQLLRIRVRPYYIFHAKQVKGTGHFVTSVDEGIEIMDKLRGYTSGLAVPAYIINAPNGFGKTPVLPRYVIGRDDHHITLRTWEKRLIQYPSESSSKLVR
ncbi:glutamate 2,3-aminomutase [Desulfotomaculum copahuensis]|uniref:Glutamate 2,3-aminomutase n=1 Tax=Desulfotomaculum copahuensis TaxID=1838280 RepID=A0A1B7LIF2_9FIRM|nr:glutamate 2,3-aminomutase [Desulfotomaculum copahuensis]OAT86347.1 glutamate 2,3-aminomutase [Desulfotomaculum copahuensis]